MENERERDVIAGRNAVTEALKAGRPIDSILVRRGEKNGSVSSILRMAKQAGIPVKEVDSRKLDGMCGGENHQGVIAMAAVHAFSEVEDIFALAESRNEPPFILVCDEIADPHNLGAILRTAECAGVHGVVIPKRRSVGLTAAVGKASAGAVEYVPVARVTNIAVFLEEIKARRLGIRRGYGRHGLVPNRFLRPGSACCRLRRLRRVQTCERKIGFYRFSADEGQNQFAERFGGLRRALL